VRDGLHEITSIFFIEWIKHALGLEVGKQAPAVVEVHRYIMVQRKRNVHNAIPELHEHVDVAEKICKPWKTVFSIDDVGASRPEIDVWDIGH
jgi:hypothetical protein